MVYKLKKVERTNMFKINGKNDKYIYIYVGIFKAYQCICY